MVIIVDTREQKALTFKVETIRKTLKFGDYGAMVGDYQIPVVFERKGLGDLYGSLTFGYDRFRREFERAEKANFKIIIAIEGTKERVLEGYHHSARDPASIIKQLETIHRKYGVEHKFFKSRSEMTNYITEFFDYKEKEYLICQNSVNLDKPLDSQKPQTNTHSSTLETTEPNHITVISQSPKHITLPG